MSGQTISHDGIVENLGEGGMGIMYQALDTRRDRTVAQKFLPSHISLGEDNRAQRKANGVGSS
ncbi:MAG TPA: hypothetical protein VMG09_14195 [Bacteroidota bacterium]|nr:hypothetical protein [Bacteroidota bacterium]